MTGTTVAGPAKEIELSSERGANKIRLAVGLTILLLSAIAAVPFFFMGGSTPASPTELKMPVTHDMHLHYEQMKSFYHGLRSGAVYPRWEEDTNRHFGAPTMSYYPPAIYYLTSFCFGILGTWWGGLLAAHLALITASAASLYLYARQTMSRFASLVAMTAYVFLPYHILDQYQRGAMAELLGFVWMPLMLFFGERLLCRPMTGSDLVANKNPDVRSHWTTNFVGLAIAYGLFLWSHPPTAYQFTLAFGVFVLIVAVRQRNLKGLLYVGSAMTLAIGVSAAYLVSAALEQDLIKHEYVSENWPYHATYVFLHALPYRDPHMGFFNLIDAVWAFYAVSIGIGALLVILVRRTRLPVGSIEQAARWIIMGIFVAFMMTKLSYFAGGKFIPKIDIGVFAWRMLAINTVVVALLAGAFAETAFARHRLGKKARILLGIAATFLVGGGIAISALLVVRPMYSAPAFVPSLEHFNLAMIPRTAPEDPTTLPHLQEARLENTQGEIVIRRWDPEERQLEVFMTESDRLVIRTFNFPGWTATVDDEPATIITGSELGEITIELSAGIHEVSLIYKNTAERNAGEAITFSSLTVLGLMIVIPILRRSRSTGRRV